MGSSRRQDRSEPEEMILRSEGLDSLMRAIEEQDSDEVLASASPLVPNEDLVKSADVMVASLELEQDSSQSDVTEEISLELAALNEEIEVIFNSNIVSKTRKNYINSLTRFVLHLFTNGNEGLLSTSLAEELQALAANESNGKMKRMRNSARTHLEAASTEYQPVKLDILKPVEFIRFVCSMTDTVNGHYLQPTTYGSHRSALSSLFSSSNVVPSTEFKMTLARYYAGLKRRAASANGQKGKKLGYGKRPMSFCLYRTLCKWLLAEDGAEAIFAHAFLTTTWNLICRSKNTTLIHRCHVGWMNDALTIMFAHSKKDQQGKKSGQVRHIYANPFMPDICCVSSISRYLATFSVGSDSKLFPGDSQYDRFRKILTKMLKKHCMELYRMGVDHSDIGVHSIRKGAATFVSSGTTAGVSFASLCNRCGWTMGTQDRYLQYEAAGDQVVGRTVAALPASSHEFLVSPPRLLPTGTLAEVEMLEGDIDNAILSVFPDFGTMNLLLGRFLLASLLFSVSWMKQSLPSSSKLFHSPVFREDYRHLGDHVGVVYPYDEVKEVSVWKTTFTGQTPFATMLAKQMETNLIIKEMTKEHADRIIGEVKEDLDRRCIGGGEMTMDRIQNDIVQPLFHEFTRQFEPFRNALQNKSCAMPYQKKGIEPWFKKACAVPSGFVLPTNPTPLQMWIYWHFGMEIAKAGEENSDADGEGTKLQRTPPFKVISCSQLGHSGDSNKKHVHSSMRYMCTQLDELANIRALKKGDLSAKMLSRLFFEPEIQNIVPKHTEKKTKRRISQCCWTTYVRHLRKALKKGHTVKQVKNLKRCQADASIQQVTTKKFKRGEPKLVVKKEAVRSKPREKNMKNKYERMASNTVVHRINGPDRKRPSRGLDFVCATGMGALVTQGKMLNGSCILCYLNLLLCGENFENGVRRGTIYFAKVLLENKDWDTTKVKLNQADMACADIVWDNTLLLIIPIFIGDDNCGHWTLLVVDRTRRVEGDVLYFDSSSGTTTFPGWLRQQLSKTPIVREGALFCKVPSPQQGKGTNDCGVWLCVFAAVYLGYAASRINKSNKAGIASNTHNLEIIIRSGDTTSLGKLGRHHMERSFQNGRVDLNDTPLRNLQIGLRE